ncbi:hypothetical protein DCS_06872 [Drechmeria coniospora]|uniref:Uncharacterized protein n=1 Tax=Drechmeria coniospora TaxID=98403 RepID=A0A151GCY4_DRECN|nr:hypothetical protein DCS_06872 [Drechmeria coniospora]KYK54911.1 hypothetical protein DCS_06872 [Drechmeria coniospora]
MLLQHTSIAGIMELLPQFKQKYHIISNDSQESSGDGFKAPQAPLKRWLLLVLFAWWNVIAFGWALYGFQAYLGSDEPAVTAISCDCGASLDEATAMGCKYDALSVSWLPPQCRDDELAAEFNRAGPGPNGEWSYWADRNQTRPLTVDEVAALAAKPVEDAQFWTTFGWHVSHCSFYWRKEHRMREKGFQVEHRYDKESHVKHCHMTFMARTPLQVTNTQAVVGLGGDRIGGIVMKHETEKEDKKDEHARGHHHH